MKRFSKYVSIVAIVLIYFTAFSLNANAANKVSKPGLVKTKSATVNSFNSVSLKWNRMTDAKGYEIYVSNQKHGKYAYVKRITNKNITTTNIYNLKCGKKYFFEICAYKASGTKRLYGQKTRFTVVTPQLSKPKMNSVIKLDETTIMLNWTRVYGAEGYVVYRSDQESGRYKKIRVINGNSAVNYKIKYLKNGVKGYYKVRAFRIVNGKYAMSNYSNIKSYRRTTYGYADESYNDRSRRVFGTDYYNDYNSSDEAYSHMTTITVDVWNIDRNGNKYITQKRITVNSGIASTVQQIFKEILNGPEKFPIKDVGCYSWRGDSSTSEHCEGLAIDINSNENYMIDGDTIMAGSLWSPGVNPYSIPENGDVVRAFAKYGFSQGLWGYRRDYMHFSYFGG